MTGTARPASFFSRHPLLSLAAAVTLLAALWIGWFLATFDLNDYRDTLAAALEQQLRQPVQLGEARLQLRKGGVALRFASLQIGSEQASDELKADTLWLQLAWRGLLLGRPEFAGITIDRPRLRMVLPTTAERAESGAEPGQTVTEAAAEPTAKPLWQQFGMRRLEIRGGELDLGWPQRDGTLKRLQFHSLNGSLDDLGLGRTATFALAGELGGDAATAGRFRLDGRLDGQSAGDWKALGWDVVLEGRQLDAVALAALLPAPAGVTAVGSADLRLRITGVVKSSLTVEIDLHGQSLAIRPGEVYRQPVPVSRLRTKAIWEPRPAGGILRLSALQTDSLQLSGEIGLSADEGGTSLSIALSDVTLPAAGLRRWMPPTLAERYRLLGGLQDGGGGFLHRLDLHARLPAGGGEAALSVDALEGDLRDLRWVLTGGHTAQLRAVGVKLADRRWHLTGGQASVADLPLTFSGSLPAESTGQVDLAIDATLPAAQVAAFWEKRPEELDLTGTLAVHGRLSGSPDAPRLSAAADLSALDVRYGKHLHLPPAPGTLASLEATLSPTALAIEQGSCTLPGLIATVQGAVEWSGAPSLRLSGKLQVADLAALRPLAPAIGTLRLAGGIEGEWTLSGPLAAPQAAASLNLRQVAIHAHGIVADVSAIQGRLQLEGARLRSGPLTARLGTSPVRLWAQVADLARPRLELKVEAPAVRANELIFPSASSILRDLAGQLVIDGEGLDFNGINVRLDGGTRATVRGTLRNFAEPHTDLDIRGPFANVEEIIALWHHDRPAGGAAAPPAGTGTAPPPAAHRHVTRIVARAEAGTLYGMHFSAATATIVPSHDLLLIHPLDFKAGEGHCTAQVLVDYRRTEPVLRISGHTENTDAYAVFNQLLGRKSILRGTLRGDFHLQGEVGRRGFLPTSFGQFNATVNDGVMRHSPVLSTLFSLLNVSQLFSFKLPDIDSEGLPFSRLEARVGLDRGSLSSDHLVIDSDAMNMAYSGSYNLIDNRLDLLAVAKPLGTVDKLVTRLPIAGWILGGEEKALITAHFRITGPAEKPEVEAIPITAMSKGVLGVFKRALSLPVKLVEDPAILWGGGGGEKD